VHALPRGVLRSPAVAYAHNCFEKARREIQRQALARLVGLADERSRSSRYGCAARVTIYKKILAEETGPPPSAGFLLLKSDGETMVSSDEICRFR
jgi:hypothetical protein